MKTKIKVTVTAFVEVEHEVGEDLTQRQADIYLHGVGELGHQNKEDIGGDVTIEVFEEEMTLEQICKELGRDIKIVKEQR